MTFNKTVNEFALFCYVAKNKNLLLYAEIQDNK